MNLIVVGELKIGYDEEPDVLEAVDPAITAEIGVLELTKNSLEKDIENAHDKIIKLNAYLHSANIDVVNEFQALQDEYEALMQEIIRKSMAEQNRSTDNQESGYSYEEQESSEEQPVEKKKISARVKKLFGQIAAKTHPDRTIKNSEEVRGAKKRLFLRAKIARDADNFAELKNIWEELNHLSRSLLNILLGKLGLLRKAVENAKRELKNIKVSDSYKMAHDMELGNTYNVNAHYRKIIQFRIAEFKNKIKALNPDRY